MPDRELFELRGAQYELSISIDAPRQRVWRALTDQLGSWWLPDFHMLGEDSIVSLELQAGGRLYEQNGDQELLWYTVLAVAPGIAEHGRLLHARFWRTPDNDAGREASSQWRGNNAVDHRRIVWSSARRWRYRRLCSLGWVCAGSEPYGGLG